MKSKKFIKKTLNVKLHEKTIKNSYITTFLDNGFNKNVQLIIPGV